MSSTNRRWDFAAFEHSYLGENVRYADQKGAFALAVPVGVLTFAFHDDLLSQSILGHSTSTPLLLAVMIGTVLLMIAAAFALAALLPRLWTNNSPGLVFWDEVVNYTHDTYALVVKEQHDDELTHQLLEQCRTVAGICRRKFSLITGSMWSSAAGCILLLLPMAASRVDSVRGLHAQGALELAIVHVGELASFTQNGAPPDVRAEILADLDARLADLRHLTSSSVARRTVGACAGISLLVQQDREDPLNTVLDSCRAALERLRRSR